jgi:VWFA-related protein
MMPSPKQPVTRFKRLLRFVPVLALLPLILLVLLNWPTAAKQQSQEPNQPQPQNQNQPQNQTEPQNQTPPQTQPLPPPPTPSQVPGPQRNAPPRQNQPSRIFVPTYTVIVPVTVKDKQGQLVGDLQKGDFRIFADQVEQKIQNFSADAVPLSAVVLIDNDLPDKAADQVQKSLVSISAGFGPSDEAAVVSYQQYPQTVSDFSFNNDKLFTQLQRIELTSHSTAIVNDPTTAGPLINGKPVPNGMGVPIHGSKRPKSDTSLTDAVYYAADMLKSRGRDRRKMIFLVSDGSNTDNEHTFDETMHSLLAADVSVYAISVSHELPIGKSIAQRGAAVMQKYAVETGGDTFYAAKQSDLERLYANVTEEARNQYTLTFSPEDVSNDRDFHQIEVRVRRPNLEVTARQGYYQSAIGVGH